MTPEPPPNASPRPGSSGPPPLGPAAMATSRPHGRVSEAIVLELAGTAPWVRFLGVAALLFAVALFGLLARLARDAEMVTVVLAALLAPLALFNLLYGWWLLRYASALRAARYGSLRRVEESLERQRDVWRLAGVFQVLVILASAGLVFLGGLVSLLAGAR